MLLYRATRYRIYPTAEQEARLRRWQDDLRWLWNLALEQRLAGLSRPLVHAVARCASCGAVPHPADSGTAWKCGRCGGRVPATGRAADAHDERIFVKYLQQQAELTELRALRTSLEDVPCNACQGVLRELDKAWDRCLKGLAARPRWKTKRGDPLSLFTSAPAFKVGRDTVTFPKLGAIRAVVHRLAVGTPKTIRIQREVDQWFAVVSCEIEVADPAPHAGPAVGIDRGVVNMLADSDGRIVANSFGRSGGRKNSRHPAGGAACGGSGSSRPTMQEEPVARPAPSYGAPEVDPCAGEGSLRGDPVAWAPRVARAQRDVARKVESAKAAGRRADGANLRKARERVAKLQRKQRRQRDHVLHSESKRYAEQYGTIALEKLNVTAMSASAKGTAEQPGRNVRQKAGLNRGIAGAAWSKFGELLKYKSEERGGRVVEVPAAHSSQTCSACSHVAAESRRTQAEFLCVACGFTEHADVNAAKVILARGLAGQTAAPKAPKKKLRVLKRARKGSAKAQTAAVPAVEACGGDRS